MAQLTSWTLFLFYKVTITATMVGRLLNICNCRDVKQGVAGKENGELTPLPFTCAHLFFLWTDINQAKHSGKSLKWLRERERNPDKICVSYAKIFCQV